MRLKLLVIVAMSRRVLISKSTLFQNSTSDIYKVINFPSSFFSKVTKQPSLRDFLCYGHMPRAAIVVPH
jgi:hypothetical protein